jgi:hypothetical protein
MSEYSFLIVWGVVFYLISTKAKKCNQNSSKWLIIAFICFVSVFFFNFERLTYFVAIG